jgi:hypothetical protein
VLTVPHRRDRCREPDVLADSLGSVSVHNPGHDADLWLWRMQGSFIDSVMATTKDFYRDLVQGLRSLKTPPPKLNKQPEEETIEAVAGQSPVIQEAIEEASEEIVEQAGTPPRG